MVLRKSLEPAYKMLDIKEHQGSESNQDGMSDDWKEAETRGRGQWDVQGAVWDVEFGETTGTVFIPLY